MIDQNGCSNGRPAPLTYIGWRDSIAEELARLDPHYTTGSRIYSEEVNDCLYKDLPETIEEAFEEEMKAQEQNEKNALKLLKEEKL